MLYFKKERVYFSQTNEQQSIGSTLSEWLPEGHEGPSKLATHGNAIQPKVT